MPVSWLVVSLVAMPTGHPVAMTGRNTADREQFTELGYRPLLVDISEFESSRAV